ncbi:MAG: hypothetical protein ABMA26_10685 [Limisphaerales bacterium]
MSIICRHCLKTNRVRKELRGKWTRCQFCHAEMEEPAPPVSKTQRKEPVVVANERKPETVTVVTAGAKSSGGGFGALVVIALVIVAILGIRHWSEQQRIERQKRAADERQMMNLLMGGASALVDGLSRPSPPQRPQDIGPYNPALRSPPQPSVERETTTLYDNNNNPVGKAYTTREVPAR